MAITINSINSLQTYLNGVMNRSEHHAGNVEGVALALLGAVMWKADGEIEVREYNGRPANVIWFHISGNKYALTYNHSDETIDLRERTQSGSVIEQFSNATTYKQIIDAFSRL